MLNYRVCSDFHETNIPDIMQKVIRLTIRQIKTSTNDSELRKHIELFMIYSSSSQLNK